MKVYVKEHMPNFIELQITKTFILLLVCILYRYVSFTASLSLRSFFVNLKRESSQPKVSHESSSVVEYESI